MHVWISLDEFTCCGDAFTVGDDIRWPLIPLGSEEPPTAGFEGVGVAYAFYPHITPDSSGAKLVRGIVLHIKGAYAKPARLEPREYWQDVPPEGTFIPGAGVWRPTELVPGSRELREGYIDPPGLCLEGWLVEVHPTAQLEEFGS